MISANYGQQADSYGGSYGSNKEEESVVQQTINTFPSFTAKSNDNKEEIKVGERTIKEDGQVVILNSPQRHIRFKADQYNSESPTKSLFSKQLVPISPRVKEGVQDNNDSFKIEMIQRPQQSFRRRNYGD